MMHKVMRARMCPYAVQRRMELFGFLIGLQGNWEDSNHLHSVTEIAGIATFPALMASSVSHEILLKKEF